jgi:hypothetical protein
VSSKADKLRFEKLRELGCIACRIALKPSPCGHTEIHHLVDKGNRKSSGGHAATIPLGRWHHQGIPFIDRTAGYMRANFGPSMRLQKREFTQTYGTQRELLARVNVAIGLPTRGLGL